jgi:hypothetical protein
MPSISAGPVAGYEGVIMVAVGVLVSASLADVISRPDVLS